MGRWTLPRGSTKGYFDNSSNQSETESGPEYNAPYELSLTGVVLLKMVHFDNVAISQKPVEMHVSRTVHCTRGVLRVRTQCYFFEILRRFFVFKHFRS